MLATSSLVSASKRLICSLQETVPDLTIHGVLLTGKPNTFLLNYVNSNNSLCNLFHGRHSHMFHDLLLLAIKIILWTATPQ